MRGLTETKSKIASVVFVTAFYTGLLQTLYSYSPNIGLRYVVANFLFTVLITVVAGMLAVFTTQWATTKNIQTTADKRDNGENPE